MANNAELKELQAKIAQQLIELRSLRGMTQTELARRVGTAQSSIARLENRRRVRDLDFLRRVADALDADLEIRLVPLKTRRRNKQV